jgi:hypothetical protein
MVVEAPLFIREYPLGTDPFNHAEQISPQWREDVVDQCPPDSSFCVWQSILIP